MPKSSKTPVRNLQRPLGLNYDVLETHRRCSTSQKGAKTRENGNCGKGNRGKWKLWKMEIVENVNCGKCKLSKIEIVENGNC